MKLNYALKHNEVKIMLKITLFWVGAILGIIAGVIGCKIYRPLSYLIFGIMIFSLFFMPLSINFFSVELYRGTSRGFEIHLSDLLALILAFLILQRPGPQRPYWLPPMSLPFFIYIAAALLSWIFTENSLFNSFSRDPAAIFRREGYIESEFDTWLYPLFEISKLLRGYVIFWVSFNFINDKKAVETISITAVLMLVYAGINALFQRYILGIHRVTALSDINIFNCFVGMLGAFIAPFAFYAKNILSSGVYWIGVVAALGTLILTVSRSSLVGFLIALLLVITLSLLRLGSLRNYLATGLVVFIGCALIAKSYDTLVNRFIYNETITNSLEGRQLYNEEAYLMGQEHFFGVGINNFAAFSVSEYGDRVGAERGALAHNIWLLTFAEMGYFGVLALLVLWIRYYMLFFQAWMLEKRHKDNFIYTILVGVFAAMFILQIQNLFHFAFRHTSVFFLSCLLMALTSRIWVILKSEQLS